MVNKLFGSPGFGTRVGNSGSPKSVSPKSLSPKSVSPKSVSEISNFLGDISNQNFMSAHLCLAHTLILKFKKVKKWFRFWPKTNPKSKFSRKWAKLLLATKNSFEKSLRLHKGPNKYHIFSTDFSLWESNRFKSRSFERKTGEIPRKWLLVNFESTREFRIHIKDYKDLMESISNVKFCFGPDFNHVWNP